MARVESVALERALENGGVITRAELLAIGVASTTITRRVSTGHLVSVGHGVYALPGVLDSEKTLLRAATHALDAIASHESAGRIHGFEGLDANRPTVAVPVRRSNRFTGVTVHQLTDIDEDDATEIDGIPVTKPVRTVIDLSAVLPQRRLADIVDRVERTKVASYEAISEHLERIARRGKPGVTKLRSILKPRLGGQIVTESALETRLVEVLRSGGLPFPESQFQPPWLRQMNGRVDLAYVNERIIVEGDSRRWHGTPEAFQTDRHRDNLAQLAGWTILRFTWEDITKRAAYVAGTVTAALKRSQRRDDRQRSSQH